MQQSCYSKLWPQVYGMELQSLASIFAYCLKGGFWQAVRWQVFETQSKGGTGKNRGRKASADHTISNSQTLSTLKCHSCNQPFHLRGARSSTSATQEEPALKLKGFRQLGPLTVTICRPLSFSRDPQPWGLLLLRASTSVPFMKCQESWVLIEKQLMEKLGAEPEPRELERVVRVTPATITKVAKNI